MLLLAILLPPLGLYLLVLGWLNRRPRPVMTPGTWDFAGVLFAVSGFLLFGGPALLGSLDDRARVFWLLGEAESSRPPYAGNWIFWIVLRLLYFMLVAGGSVAILLNYRRITSIYNADAPAVFDALETAVRRLGLHYRRTGECLWIGRPPPVVTKAAPDEGAQAPGPADAPADVPFGPITDLSVDAFPLMRHVTLRWEPADAPIRRDVEGELARTLAEAPAPESESLVGWVLLLFGFTLVFVALFGGVFVLWRHVFPR